MQVYFAYAIEKHETLTNNSPIRIHVNRIGNRMMFKVERGYYLKLVTPETIKLLGSTKIGENVPHLKITELVLVYFHMVNNYYQHDSRVLQTLFLINLLVNCKISHPKSFQKPLIQIFHILTYGLLIIILNRKR